MNGLIFPLDEQLKISNLARNSRVKMHLDGARIWNAMTATGLSLRQLAEPFDSVSLCFSKGLGAPMGSVLVGSSSFIKKARHFRKLYGGGFRQTGLLAAACDFALEHHLPKLYIDHQKARRLADALQEMGFVLILPCETNMVWLDTSPMNLTAEDIRIALAESGIGICGGSDRKLRLVVHHQISEAAISTTIEAFRNLLKTRK